MEAKAILALILLITFVFAMIWLYVHNHYDIIKKIVLSCVVEAEKYLGSGTGALKYAYVVDKVYEKLPGIVTMFLSKENLNRLIEFSVSKLKDVLSDGKTLTGYEDEALFQQANLLTDKKE